MRRTLVLNVKLFSDVKEMPRTSAPIFGVNYDKQRALMKAKFYSELMLILQFVIVYPDLSGLTKEASFLHVPVTACRQTYRTHMPKGILFTMRKRCLVRLRRMTSMGSLMNLTFYS